MDDDVDDSDADDEYDSDEDVVGDIESGCGIVNGRISMCDALGA